MAARQPESIEIIEELGDRVIEQIEKLAVKGFDTALNEMVEY